jgi:polyhydroxyalkanoate synthesis regulator phasin
MPKTLTREQLKRRKDQAVRFTRDMLGDAGRAEEIASETVEDYAQRRGIELSNPRRDYMARKKIADYREELEDLKRQVRDLEEENETLQDQLDRVGAIVSGEEDEGEDDDEDEDADLDEEEPE